MSEVYRMFANDWKDCLDFSDEAAVELYNYESYGGSLSPKNGFGVGKKWLNVTVKYWRQDIQEGLLFKQELYSDPMLPHWFLDSVLSGV